MTPALSARIGRLAPMALLVLAGAFALAVIVASPADAEFGYDLDAYLLAADRLIAGEPLYPSTTGGLTPIGAGAYFYPPTTALAFVPLSGLPVELTRLAWFAALVVLATGVGYVLVRGIEPERRAMAAAGYLAFLPLLSELRFGNLNLVTLALCLIGWRLRERAAISGLVFAVAIGLKLLPLAIVAFLLAAGRWRIVAWAAAASAAVVLGTWPWLGPRWLEYAAVLGGIGIGAPAGASNIVPAGLAMSPLRYVLPLTGLVAAALCGLAVRGRRDPDHETVGFDAALAAAPLLATSVWYTYLVLALPVLLRRAARLPGRAPSGRGLPGWRPISWLAMEARLSPLPICGLLGLVTAAIIEVRAARPELPEAPR